ncbi:hypothetical protein [Longitalea luteola]|uniref:hypothetical protein n=1 Tax=Longitalea luteola TaxID=2812563 RepID=UPI001A960DD1|nr:hypothetical protein [Longitalea luteola]
MDLESMQYYEESPEEKRRRKKAEEESAKFMGVLLKTIGTWFLLAFIYSSSLFAAYFILNDSKFFASLKGWEQVIAVMFLAYLISSLVFFLKGIMIVLRAYRNWWWIVIWVVCFVFVCLLPTVMVYFILENILGPSIPAKRDGISHYQFWSQVGAIVAGGFIYHKYGLSRDNVLRISAWAYSLGKRAGLALTGHRK